VSASAVAAQETAAAPRPTLEVDVAGVGFGPAMGGFLVTLARGLAERPPLQVVCYERADDIGFGVSGAATRARALRASFPGLEAGQIPLAARIREEKLVYLLDPVGASRRGVAQRTADGLVRALTRALPVEREALVLPWIPPFLRKEGGLVLSIGQLNQWVGQQLMAGGQVQIWPATPVAEPLVEGTRVAGVRLVDQGTDAEGRAAAGYMPGMDVRASLTVIGDGPTGSVGRQLDARLGRPPAHEARDWAVGMKALVALREDTELEPGTVVHTFGYPEPEIFGFLYVLPEKLASCGIFVPSWFRSPVRTAYRYLQHFMLHPWLSHHLEGGQLRSWGAKTIAESGRRGEPFLAGDGWARIGEGSGSTNVLTGSGVDEAWATGVQLGEGVLELVEKGEPFTRGNLERAYVARRRASFVEAEGRVAARARDGFAWGFVPGLLGMALAGFSRGRLSFPARRSPEPPPTLEAYYRGRIEPAEIERIRTDCAARGVSLHGALMERSGWPPIPFDGRLLVTHQDALLLGGKVRAPAGYADHVVVLDPRRCETCGARICIEVCSGQALTPGPGGRPAFDREKCVHCGACQWSCSEPHPLDPSRTNLELRSGAGGLHSSEN
jgi:electron-transferring-flavoprotein dehydrogenase